MAEKRINCRIINKHGTEAYWLANPDFIPNQSEVIVYDKDDNHTHERMKIGDGVTKVNDLPFHVSEIELESKLSEVRKQIMQVSETKPVFSCMWFNVKS